MALLQHQRAGAGPCPVCGGRCGAFPDSDHLSTYPFLPGGHDPMEGQTYVTAPHRIVDHDLGRVVYSPGARVPMADSIKYGLIAPQEADVKAEGKPASKRPKGKRRPAEDRARKPGEDR